MGKRLDKSKKELDKLNSKKVIKIEDRKKRGTILTEGESKMAVSMAYLPPVEGEKVDRFLQGLNDSFIDYDYLEECEEKCKHINIDIDIDGL